VQQPRLPIKPEYPNPQRINSKAQSIINLSPEQRELWRDWIRDYKLTTKESDKIFNGLSIITIIITNSVSYSNKQSIIGINSPYQILRILQSKLAPTNESRKRHII
jgi:hypothetical protein